MTGIIERLMALRPSLEHGRKTHIDWAEHFEAYPHDSRNQYLGDAVFHRKLEAEYDERLATITLAIQELESQSRWKNNAQCGWAALHLIREALTEWAPPGSLEASEYAEGTEYVHEAEQLIRAIRSLYDRATKDD